MTAHTIEPAASGRAKCRGCGERIGKGELRLGERLPNPFADDGDMVLWFHLGCAAYKRPEPFLEALAAFDAERTELPEGAEPPGAEERQRMVATAKLGLEHRRLPRIDAAERAPSGRAKCRHCKEPIAKGAWRLKLLYFDEGMFNPSGYIHAGCAEEYVGTADVVERARRFSGELDAEAQASLAEALGSD